VLGAPLPGVKQQTIDANHSSPSGAEVMKVWSYFCVPPHAFVACTNMSTFTWFICFESWSLLFTVLFSDAANISVYIVSSDGTNNENGLEGKGMEGFW